MNQPKIAIWNEYFRRHKERAFYDLWMALSEPIPILPQPTKDELELMQLMVEMELN